MATKQVAGSLRRLKARLLLRIHDVIPALKVRRRHLCQWSVAGGPCVIANSRATRILHCAHIRTIKALRPRHTQGHPDTLVQPPRIKYHSSLMTTTNEAPRTLDHSPAPAETDPTAADNTYPPQRHAGAVGYGPEYGKGTVRRPSINTLCVSLIGCMKGTSDKLQGLKEEFKGKLLHKPELVQHGRELRTGELKRKENEADVRLYLILRNVIDSRISRS